VVKSASCPDRFTPKEKVPGTNLSLLCLMVAICTIKFNIQNFYVPLAQCTSVLCMDLATNSDYFRLQQWLACFITEKCLLSGTKRIFKYYSVAFLFTPLHSTHVPRSHSSTSRSDQKGQRMKLVKLPRSNALWEIGERCINKYFHLSSSLKV